MEHLEIAIRNHLDANYPNKWIKQDEFLVRLAHTMDLNPLAFLFWKHLKSAMYQARMITMEDLTALIIFGSAAIAAFRVFFNLTNKPSFDLTV